LISSRIEIIERGYRYSSTLVDIYGSSCREAVAFGATSPLPFVATNEQRTRD
jgi:hypothetical protein